jgi:hypothetical protein
VERAGAEADGGAVRAECERRLVEHSRVFFGALFSFVGAIYSTHTEPSLLCSTQLLIVRRYVCPHSHAKHAQ